MSERISLSDVYELSQESPISHLLLVLVAQLTEQIELSDMELFTVKSWLVQRAEDFEPGEFVDISAADEDEEMEILARVGKDELGEVVLWHVPLPWPFEHEPDEIDLEDIIDPEDLDL